MSERLASHSYDSVSKSLHWLIALLAFSQLAMGKFFEVEADEEGSLFVWHTTFGLLVLALMLVRLAWRLGHTPPGRRHHPQPQDPHGADGRSRGAGMCSVPRRDL